MTSEIERLTAENERLKEQQNKLWQLSANSIPFDLKGSINSIRGYTELLLAYESENLTEQQREFLGKIKSTALRLADLTQTVADYARFGIIPTDDSDAIPVQSIKDQFILPCKIQSDEADTLMFEVTEQFSADAERYGIHVDFHGLHRIIDRLFWELYNFYLIEKLQIVISTLGENCAISIKSEKSIRERPFITGSDRNRYEDGQVDYVAREFFELYGGTMESGVEDDSVVLTIKLPLVKL